MFCCYILGAFSFPVTDKKAVDPDGNGGREQLEEVDGEETLVIQYLRGKKTIFNKRGKRY